MGATKKEFQEIREEEQISKQKQDEQEFIHQTFGGKKTSTSHQKKR